MVEMASENLEKYVLSRHTFFEDGILTVLN